MPSAPIHTHTRKAGTCPHGLPLGACPICNGMAGGNSTTKRDTPRNVGEMTYNQCAAIGAMLRAQKHAKEQAKIAQQNHINALSEFNKSINSNNQRIMDIKMFIQANFPKVVSIPVSVALNVVLLSLKFVQAIPNFVANTFYTVMQKFANITDKLAAVYGEAKAFVKEKISKFSENLKKKLKSLFFIDTKSDVEEEEKKIEEEKRIFDLKFMFNKIFKNLNKEQQEEINQNGHNQT